MVPGFEPSIVELIPEAMMVKMVRTAEMPDDRQLFIVTNVGKSSPMNEPEKDQGWPILKMMAAGIEEGQLTSLKVCRRLEPDTEIMMSIWCIT